MKISNERGFTIIEALFAIVILTIALVSLAELMAITLRMQMLGRNQANPVRVLTVRVIPTVNDYRTSTPVEVVTLIRCWPCA